MVQISSRLEFPTEGYDCFSGLRSAETTVIWYSVFNTNFVDTSVVLAYK
jgi:hypothetical protein